MIVRIVFLIGVTLGIVWWKQILYIFNDTVMYKYTVFGTFPYYV